MIIHHENNRDRMNSAIQLAKTRRMHKRISEQSKLQAYLQQNKECEKILREHAKLPQDALISSVTIESFAKPVKSLLFAFCKVYHHADLKSCHKHIPTLKGKLGECYKDILTKPGVLVDDVNKLIHYAFLHRAKPILAEVPTDFDVECKSSNCPRIDRYSCN